MQRRTAPEAYSSRTCPWRRAYRTESHALEGSFHLELANTHRQGPPSPTPMGAYRRLQQNLSLTVCLLLRAVLPPVRWMAAIVSCSLQRAGRLGCFGLDHIPPFPQHDSLEAQVLDITTLQTGHEDLVPPRLIRYRHGVWICIWGCFKDLYDGSSGIASPAVKKGYLVQDLRDVGRRFELVSKVAFRRSKSEQL